MQGGWGGQGAGLHVRDRDDEKVKFKQEPQSEIMHRIIIISLSLTTQEVGVSLPGPQAGDPPVPSVPANHRAVLAEAVLAHVLPHPEQVELDPPCHGSAAPVLRTTAQPQGAGGGEGFGDDRPLCYDTPVHLKHTWGFSDDIIRNSSRNTLDQGVFKSTIW